MSYKMIDAAQSPWLAVGATTPVTIARSCEGNGSQSVSRAPQRLSVSGGVEPGCALAFRRTDTAG